MSLSTKYSGKGRNQPRRKILCTKENTTFPVPQFSTPKQFNSCSKSLMQYQFHQDSWILKNIYLSTLLSQQIITLS